MPSVLRERKPWTGKVHDPNKLWLAQQAERRNMTVADFQKTLKENIVARQDKADERLEDLETTVHSIDEKLDTLLKALGSKAAQ